MLSNKSLALALCLTITGCAQTPQNDAEGGHWWSFGSDKAATKDAVTQTDAKPDAKPAAGAKPVEPVAAAAAPAPAAKADTGYSWWPFSTKSAEEKAADAKADLKADLKAATPTSDAAPVVAKTDTEPHWWWPFESKPKPLAKVDVTNVQMPDPKITQAWLDDYEPRLREAIKGSNLQLERRDNVLVVIAPVDGSYNPKRPAMLLPVTLGPFTRVAKAVEADPKTAVLVLGHVDATGSAPASQALSKERAQSIASIFSLSGLKQDRLMLRGMGDLMPRAANDSNQGRALNRRMEIMFTQRTTMLALLSKYNSGKTPPVAEMVAVQDVPAPAPAAKAPAKKAPAKKAAAKPAAKKAAAKPAAKKPAAAKAKAAAPASNDQAKN
ncbi:OmpA family protein [Pseudomonas synxantha]|uniref:OmpA family protein n=1 Tax=Pseudomonas synxantha TaxID=47883 RepID=A0ABS0UMY4_9PSED|nr:OmpA family protein [Pseudomonas synxantha]AZE65741.1 Outer membrane protein [Pseudomonas synxantha]MBI6565667.1 OmpA family protein [Pseudomonas synxantha]MBI6581786.1 OmpA family protein [Pseudomonas synxantha]MBI6647078.1 OmpA family protein [Pseudomonas synxantha]MDQ0979552.1 outer membrane protein OmpA-like peptidoglycan-associated protein [Pseudomonas synxantha]